MKAYKVAMVMAITALWGCKKGDLGTISLNGTYSGQFSVRDNPYVSDAVEPAHHVTIKFSGNNYQSTANPDNMPAGGQGTFSIEYDEATFKDTTVHTANFDANQVLNGTYNYSTRGDSLLIVKQVNYVFYTYKLKKQ
jgi:hypothetical protein